MQSSIFIHRMHGSALVLPLRERIQPSTKFGVTCALQLGQEGQERSRSSHSLEQASQKTCEQGRITALSASRRDS